MAKSLIIVESPAKVATIKKIVGNDFVVKSSVGHIRDLPKKELGIDVENGFEPRYVIISGKGKIVSELKKAAKNVDTIFLGMDPDREGEAIAFHVAHVIGKKDVEFKRILFNEITPKAVRKSLEETKEIDMEKFYAQQARRVLDRLVGFEISPFLWKVIASGLSAGRVQTVALRIICERDEEIEAFEPKKYWTIEMMLARLGKVPFRARLHQYDGQKVEIDSQERADQIAVELKEQHFQVAEVKMRDQLRRPSPPFTTSSLQQECARRLRYSVKRTMALAQKLYEGVELEGEERRGLITYMRTDSVRVSDDAITEVRSHIESNIGPDYLPQSPVPYKTKGAAQDAHEAIRPTSVSLHPAKVREWLEPDQWRVYELIWKRFVASQMNPQVLSITTVNICAGKYVLRSSGNLVKFDGFTKLYEASDSDKSAWLVNSSSVKVGSNVVEIDGGNHEPKKGDFFVVDGDTHQYEVSAFSEGLLHFAPEAKVGWSDNAPLTLPFDGIIPDDIAAQQDLELSRLMPQEHETKPPARYTEASLVKELEAQGIGRPSTYAQIITTVVDRGYVERMNRSLKSTELGQTVRKLLVKTFPDIFNVGFTAEMEDKLDRVAEGDDNWSDTVGKFYGLWKPHLEVANAPQKRKQLKASLQEESDTECEDCGRMLVIKWGRNGRFLACPGYPECKNTKPLEEHELIDTDEICEECESPMIVKTGRFGRFIACSAYPECKSVKPFYLGMSCPEDECHTGRVVEKQTGKGKIFYGCDQYPACKFASWDKPVNKSCSHCNAPILYEKLNRGASTGIIECRVCGVKEEKDENASIETMNV